MEHGSVLGTYLAYGVIGLFLLVVGLVVARTMLLMAMLRLPPVRQVWTSLGAAGRMRRRTPTREELRLAADARPMDELRSRPADRPGGG